MATEWPAKGVDTKLITWYNAWLVSKVTVGNSWDILSAILRHKYHQNHSYVVNEASICSKSDFDHSL